MYVCYRLTYAWCPEMKAHKITLANLWITDSKVGQNTCFLHLEVESLDSYPTISVKYHRVCSTVLLIL